MKDKKSAIKLARDRVKAENVVTDLGRKLYYASLCYILTSGSVTSDATLEDTLEKIKGYSTTERKRCGKLKESQLARILTERWVHRFLPRNIREVYSDFDYAGNKHLLKYPDVADAIRMLDARLIEISILELSVGLCTNERDVSDLLNVYFQKILVAL